MDVVEDYEVWEWTADSVPPPAGDVCSQAALQARLAWLDRLLAWWLEPVSAPVDLTGLRLVTNQRELRILARQHWSIDRYVASAFDAAGSDRPAGVRSYRVDLWWLASEYVWTCFDEPELKRQLGCPALEELVEDEVLRELWVATSQWSMCIAMEEDRPSPAEQSMRPPKGVWRHQ